MSGGFWNLDPLPVTILINNDNFVIHKSIDELAIRESLNWYIYVTNNSPNKIDPIGLKAVKPPKPDKRNPEEFKRYAEYCGFECRKATKHSYHCTHKKIPNVSITIPNPHNPIEVWKKVLKQIQKYCTPLDEPEPEPQPSLCPKPKPTPQPKPILQPPSIPCEPMPVLIGGGI